MKVVINSELLEKEGFSLKDFGVLLFFLDKSERSFDDVAKHLWEKGFLTKEVEGYSVSITKYNELEGILATSSVTEDLNKRASRLATELREIFPKGKKEGTPYYWRDSHVIIQKKLLVFFKKFGSHYTDEQIIKATKNYVQEFNGDYKFMQLLKYFISKKDLIRGEDRSDLASYLENIDQTERHGDAWLTELK